MYMSDAGEEVVAPPPQNNLHGEISRIFFPKIKILKCLPEARGRGSICSVPQPPRPRTTGTAAFGSPPPAQMYNKIL